MVSTFTCTSSGQSYYYDPRTKATTWTYPLHAAPPPTAVQRAALRDEACDARMFLGLRSAATLSSAKRVKNWIMRRSLLLVLKDGMVPDMPLKRLVNSHGCMRRVLDFVDVPVKHSELRMDVAGITPYDVNRLWRLLRCKAVWCTMGTAAKVETSRCVKVPHGAQVVAFELATVHRLHAAVEVQVEEDGDGDGQGARTGGAVLVPWGAYGAVPSRIRFNHGPRHYSAAIVPVATRATKFVVRVRHDNTRRTDTAGLAIFKAHGCAP